MKIEIKHRHTGAVLFSHEEENNSMRRTVKQAVKQGVSLAYADLSGTNLSYADLSNANLSGANLSGANLSGANLADANLPEADLSHADLSHADLSNAYLFHADLSGADLSNAYLSNAYLFHADLSGADLSNAYLSGTNLSYADLSNANLSHANLSDANLFNAKLPFFQIVPQEGEFIAYKKLSNEVIIQVKIPASAKRTSSLVGRKCRCSELIPIKVVKGRVNDKHKMPGWRNRCSTGVFYYAIGEVAVPDSYDDDIRIECTNGLHFFMTLEEAEQW